MADDPISLRDRLNASVLMRVTPEYGAIRKAQGRHERHKPAGLAPSAMEPVFQEVGGIRVRYARGGRAGGPTVLLLSPLPQSILCFAPIWDRLASECEVVALDLPGFGRSDGGIEYMSFAAQSRFLETFVRALDLHGVHVVGPDVGMPVALHYVIHREHEATSIVIGDGPGIVPSANGSIINKAVDSAFWRRMFQITGAGAFVEGAFRLACVDYVPCNEELADYVASYRGRMGAVTHWFKTYPENLATVDPHLADLDLPVQLFWGDLDELLLVENARRLDERLPNSQLRVFGDCGHFSYQDRPAQFAEMLLDWVNGGYQAQ